MSNIPPSDDAIAYFNDLKTKSKYRYVIFKLNATNTSIETECSGPPEASYADFVKKLPDDECRYAIYNFDYEIEGGKRSKIVFFLWAPTASKVKSKLVAASSKEGLKKKFVGVAVEVQASDRAEIDQAIVLEKIKQTFK